MWKKTDRLYFNYYTENVIVDDKWELWSKPYLPAPSNVFIVETDGEIVRAFEVWVAYFDALFYFVHEAADLFNSPAGNLWYESSYMGNTDDDWKLDAQDLKDFIHILKTVTLYEPNPKPEHTYLPEISKL